MSLREDGKQGKERRQGARRACRTTLIFWKAAKAVEFDSLEKKLRSAGKASIGKMQTKATTTPHVYSIWSGFWSKYLTRQQQMANPDRQKRKLFLKQLARNARAPAKPRSGPLPSSVVVPEKFSMSWIGKPLKFEKETGRTYYESVKLNNCVRKKGEV